MLEEQKHEREELGKAPDQEIKVWGLGLTNKKLDKLIELQDRTNFLTAKSEEKLKAIIDLLLKQKQ